jgi:hypothetical protein
MKKKVGAFGRGNTTGSSEDANINTYLKPHLQLPIEYTSIQILINWN